MYVSDQSTIHFRSNPGEVGSYSTSISQDELPESLSMMHRRSLLVGELANDSSQPEIVSRKALKIINRYRTKIRLYVLICIGGTVNRGRILYLFTFWSFKKSSFQRMFKLKGRLRKPFTLFMQ